MSLPSRELVLRKLAVAFPDAAAAQDALQVLDRVTNRKGEPELPIDGIQLAIIKLCQGKLWRVHALVEKAQKDFKDVLYPAQAPERYRRQQQNSLRLWSSKNNKKSLSPTQDEAMNQRDQRQWIEWLCS